jgi:L1 cell adhesion molecule like protein
LNLKILRTDLNKLCEELFEVCIKILNETTKESKISKNEIDEVVLVGGSSRIPKIQEMIKQSFKNIKIQKSINPDEAIAYGAGLYANNKFGYNIGDLVVVDVLPFSYGIGVFGGEMSFILTKNTPLKECKKDKIYTTSGDDQNSLRIRVFEGENTEVDKNTLLNVYYLNNITVAKKGVTRMKVIFEFNEKMTILIIRAFEINNENNKLERTINVTQQKELERSDNHKIIRDFKGMRTDNINYFTFDNINRSERSNDTFYKREYDYEKKTDGEEKYRRKEKSKSNKGFLDDICSCF